MFGGRRRLIAGACATAVVLYARTAGGEPVAEEAPEPIHVLSPSTITTEKGNSLALPPGWFLAEPLMVKLDTELRRLQDAETRLTAENESLRKSAATAVGPGWQAALVLVGVALAGGIALERWVF